MQDLNEITDYESNFVGNWIRLGDGVHRSSLRVYLAGNLIGVRVQKIIDREIQR